MANGLARGRVRTTTTTTTAAELSNVVAMSQKGTYSFGLPSTSLKLVIHAIIN